MIFRCWGQAASQAAQDTQLSAPLFLSRIMRNIQSDFGSALYRDQLFQAEKMPGMFTPLGQGMQ